MEARRVQVHPVILILVRAVLLAEHQTLVVNVAEGTAGMGTRYHPETMATTIEGSVRNEILPPPTAKMVIH
jgi:hypothetical protein